jgi:hypothetical protein
MSVNNYKIIRNQKDANIKIPIEMNWEFDGADDAIDQIEDKLVEDIVGIPKDFEISRFTHKKHPNSDQTSITYNFDFFDTPSNLWINSYQIEGFTTEEIYYFRPAFDNSFFKIDLYDTNDTTTQKIYLTIILPVTEGQTQTASISPYLPPVQIKKPNYVLDFLGDKEGFFIYWLRNRDYINIDTFYMTAKFWDAKLGTFVTMTNTPQNLILPNQYNFNPADYFYYILKLDYSDFTYTVEDINGNRVGDILPINWYEYVNP